MTTFADQIVPFFESLQTPADLPDGISVLNPYQEPEIIPLLDAYFRKFYDDTAARIPVMGINPGRYGGGVTGISFTDPVNMEVACGIANPIEKRPELSSTFIFKVIEQYGGTVKFFHRFFLTAICPLGFTKEGKNYNYYDDRELKNTVRPFIQTTFLQQHAICGYPEDCIVLGEGDNYRFIKELNEELGLFQRIHPLPHPRFIMQYKRKRIEEYISDYAKLLNGIS
ncbi:MAG TPA: DUF4918 family protein [Bacteroidales bacterium]|nr:DUF4918 family protein [Bacteroidales bacterium]HNS47432.1 DUF4918 family protein [Bacteroidales bacterium]